MIMETGATILISHRRLFEGDEPRYFVGRVVACEAPFVKAVGYSFVRDLSTGQIVKKQEQRTKLFSLSSPGFIVYQLPHEIDVENVDFKSGHGEAALLDGCRIIMDLSEHTHSGQF